MVDKMIFHIEAEDEFTDSYIWYEDKKEGLGEQFRISINNLLQDILKNPSHHPKKKLNYREAVVNTFPFIIVYEILEKINAIHVAAIFHTSRNPKLKYRKLNN